LTSATAKALPNFISTLLRLSEEQESARAGRAETQKALKANVQNIGLKNDQRILFSNPLGIKIGDFLKSYKRRINSEPNAI
jgi:hypothetical protein